jgi:hypothetical protein
LAIAALDPWSDAGINASSASTQKAQLSSGPMSSPPTTPRRDDGRPKMARKPATRVEFTLFDVAYEGGFQRSNCRPPTQAQPVLSISPFVDSVTLILLIVSLSSYVFYGKKVLDI